MLTELQRDAIAQARHGNFGLLDAMELKHRIDTRQCDVGFLHGGRLRLLGKVSGSGGLICEECGGDGTNDCPECDGSGKDECGECSARGTLTCTECEGDGCEACDEGRMPCEDCNSTGWVACENCHGKKLVACDNCGGDGSIDYDEMDAERTVRNLDGDVVFSGETCDDDDPTAVMRTVDRHWADKILRDYHKAKADAAEAANAADSARPATVHTLDFGVTP